MIKKTVVALALAVISASCLAACGNGKGGEEETAGTGITVTFDAGSVRAKYRDYLAELAQSEMIKASEFDKVKNVYKSHYDNIAKTAIDTNNTRFDANDTGNYSYSYYITHKLEILNNNINF